MKIDLVNSLEAQILCIAAFTIMWLISSWMTITFSFRNNWMTQANKIRARTLITPMINGVLLPYFGFKSNPFNHYE